jgi:hypothetical protein
MNIDTDSAVQLAASIPANHPDWDDEEIVAELKSKGVDSLYAEQLVAFVPLAFGRIFFAEDGPRFSTHYELQDLASGRKLRLPLLDEPVFVLATQLAKKWVMGELRDQARAIACRSAEVCVIAELTRNGSSPSKVGLTEPLMMRLPFPEAKSKDKPGYE